MWYPASSLGLLITNVQRGVIRSQVALIGPKSNSVVLTCAPQHKQISGGTLRLIESYCTQVSRNRATAFVDSQNKFAELVSCSAHVKDCIARLC